MTHTYVILEISQLAYDEIRAKLKAAGYDHAFHADNIVDMHGVQRVEESTGATDWISEAAQKIHDEYPSVLANCAEHTPLPWLHAVIRDARKASGWAFSEENHAELASLAGCGSPDGSAEVGQVEMFLQELKTAKETRNAAQAEATKQTLRARELAALLGESRREHEDSDKISCATMYGREACNCGADAWNARIDTALEGK